MRILTAMMKHETNSFSPVKTDLARFAAWGLHHNDAVLDAYRGTNMPIAAYIELAEQRGAEIVAPVAAEAMPSGLVERETYESLVEWVLEPLREGGIDAVFLDLHGAMTAEHLPDGEGELLRRIREIAPDVPIAVTLDLHTNLTETMVSNCDVMIGYKSYPHTDMYAVGKQIATVLWDKIEGRANPVMAWGPAPVLAQTLSMGSDDEPMKSLQDATRPRRGPARGEQGTDSGRHCVRRLPDGRRRTRRNVGGHCRGRRCRSRGGLPGSAAGSDLVGA